MNLTYKSWSIIGALLAFGTMLKGQDCIPAQDPAPSGTITGTVLARTGDLLVKTGDRLYSLDVRRAAGAGVDGIRAGDVLRIGYSDLLQCVRSGTFVGTAVRIVKQNSKPNPPPIPSDARTIQGTISEKTERRGDPKLRDFRQLSLAPNHQQNGDCSWTFEASLDDPVFPVLQRMDEVRITYLNATTLGADGTSCFATALRIVKIR